jgi:hypothetical protein
MYKVTALFVVQAALKAWVFGRLGDVGTESLGTVEAERDILPTRQSLPSVLSASLVKRFAPSYRQRW